MLKMRSKTARHLGDNCFTVMPVEGEGAGTEKQAYVRGVAPVDDR